MNTLKQEHCAAKTHRPGSTSQVACLALLALIMAGGCVSTERHVDDKPERVVSLLPSLTEAVVHIAGPDILVGMSDYCPFEAHEGRPRLGGIEPDTDGILAAEPDLVIADASQARALWPVQAAGIRVEVFPATAAPTVASRLDYAEQVGARIGRPEAGRRFAERIRSRIERVERAVVDRDHPTVLYVSRWEPLRVAAGDYVEDDIIRLAGGQNLATHLPGGSAEVDDEAVRAFDPEVLLVAQEADIEKARNRWPDLRAIQTGRCYALDLRHHRDPPRRHWEPMPANIERLAAILHPDAFPTADR